MNRFVPYIVLFLLTVLGFYLLSRCATELTRIADSNEKIQRDLKYITGIYKDYIKGLVDK